MTSASPRLDKRRRTYVRLLGEIHHALNQALSEEKVKRGLNKTKIGNLLGLGRSAISKKFDGRHNMTLETLADLAFALDRPVKILLPERVATGPTNDVIKEVTAGLPGKLKIASIVGALSPPTANQDEQDERALASPRTGRELPTAASVAGTGVLTHEQTPWRRGLASLNQDRGGVGR